MITWQKITPPEAFRRIRRGANTYTMLHTGFPAVKRVVGRMLSDETCRSTSDARDFTREARDLSV